MNILTSVLFLLTISKELFSYAAQAKMWTFQQAKQLVNYQDNGVFDTLLSLAVVKSIKVHENVDFKAHKEAIYAKYQNEEYLE